MLLLHAPHIVGVRAARRMPRVTEFQRAPDRTLRASAHPDLRLRRRHGFERRVAERPELALEVALAAPQRAQHTNGLVRAPAAAAELDAHEAELVLVPADPDAEREPTAAQLL